MSAIPSTSSGMRVARPSCARLVTAGSDVNAWMNVPTSTAFATVPTPGLPPSDHPMASTTTATATLAIPNESGVCFAMPWFSTSHGESPSFDSRISTIASAKRKRPKTRLSALAA